jgi:hypothetical protein
MYSPEQILNAAKSIYPLLPKLLDEPTSTHIQATLKPLIESEDTDQIWDVLDQYPQTEHYRSQYFKFEDIPKTRSNSQLPGDQAAERSTLIYACPNCDYRTPIFFLGMTPEPCKNHPDAELFRV